jgi:hypothetical protein
MKRAIWWSVMLLWCSGVYAQPKGAVVQGSDYDAATGVTTVHILNTSHKGITAFSIMVQVQLPDGTLSAANSNYMVRDLLEQYIREGKGIFPGETFTQELHQGPAIATVNMVAYADGTAESSDKYDGTLQEIIAERKNRAQAMQDINAVLKSGESRDAQEAKLKVLLGKHPTSGYYDTWVKTEIDNLHRGGDMSPVIARQEHEIPLFIQHAQLTKEVQP